MPVFTWQQKNDVLFLTVTAFTETGLVKHGFTSRLGGISQPPYHTLNMSFTVRDVPEKVVENRRRAAEAIGFPLEDLVALQQVHGDRVAVATSEHKGRGALNYETALPETDAVITREAGVPLSTYHADCVPVFFLDPVTPAVGLAHAGWKGTALKIAAKTLLAMHGHFGTRVEDCLVAIGPSIGPCCYEVDGRVKDIFGQAFREAGAFFQATGEEKWHLDLWEANTRALEEIGVPRRHIFVSRLCTGCRTDLFYSHRKEKGLTGRMAALIMLR